MFYNKNLFQIFQDILEGCRTTIVNGNYFCDVVKERQDCEWDGIEDPDQYRGVLDKLPPWDGPWRHGRTKKSFLN